MPFQDFSKGPPVDIGDCRHMSPWQKALKLHCDSIVHSCSVKEGATLLRDLAIKLHEGSPGAVAKIRKDLKALLLAKPLLWWSAPLGLHTASLTPKEAATYLTLDTQEALPTHLLFGWSALHTIIRYYPSHFIVFALEHLDTHTPCTPPLTEEDFLVAAAAASKIALVYRTAPHPLPVTSAVLREACRLTKWKPALQLLLPGYLEASNPRKCHSLIRHAMDVPYEVFEFLLEGLPLEAWRSYDDLLVSFVRHGPSDTRCLVKSLSKLLLRVNPEGQPPLDRVEAMAEACHFSLVQVVKLLLKSPAYPDDHLTPATLARLYTRSIEADAHECIAYLHDTHPGSEFGAPEANALLYASRATQVMCYNEDLVSDFGMASGVGLKPLTDRLDVLLGSGEHVSLVLYLCRIFSKYLELHPEDRALPCVHHLLVKLFNHPATGATAMPRFKHLLTPSTILTLACEAPHLLQAMGVDLPLHLWRVADKTLRPFYLAAHGGRPDGGCPAPLGIHPTAALDFYAHARKLAAPLGRDDLLRLGCLWDGPPFVTRRCALESLRTYTVHVYALDFYATSEALQEVWSCTRGRFLSASATVQHGEQEGAGATPTATMDVSMLDLDSLTTFHLTQVVTSPDGAPGGRGGPLDAKDQVEDYICQWRGAMPLNSNMNIKIETVSLPDVYFVVIRSVSRASLGWAPCRPLRRLQRPRPSRLLLGSRPLAPEPSPSTRLQRSRERQSPRRGPPPSTTRR